MPLPEGYRPREGDVLVLHGTVKYDVDEADTDVHVVVANQTYRPIGVPLDKVVGLYARHWNPGDKVRAVNDSKYGGEVIATYLDLVWVRLMKGAVTATFEANALEPMPESEDVAAFPPPAFTGGK